jgi:hypothetical protein
MTSSWATVRVDDTSFGVLDNGEIPIETAAWSNGLVTVMSHGAVITTGIHTGYVRVRVGLTTATPHEDDGSWEEIVEASVHAHQGHLRVDSFERGAVSTLPLLSTAGPGWYRLRVHARGRGRETNPDGVQNDPVEDYLLAIWSAPRSPTTILHTSHRIEASLHTAPPPPATQAQPNPPLQEPSFKPAPLPNERG